MVVLVTGAAGQLGQALRLISVEHTEIDFIFCDSLQLDIRDKNHCLKVFGEYRPQYCINTAAYTAVDQAEIEVEKAFDVNEKGVSNLAEVCLKMKVVLIHLSTDFVFDGFTDKPYSETALPNPQTVYGKSKLAGEKRIQHFLETHYIIRTSWLYSEFGNNFLKTMLKLGRERKEINVVNDQIGTPTHASELARVILVIIENDQGNYGIYNFSNEGQCSWYEFALEIFKVNSVAIAVHPISSEEYPTKAIRPRYSVLDKSKIKENFKVSPDSWQALVPKF